MTNNDKKFKESNLWDINKIYKEIGIFNEDKKDWEQYKKKSVKVSETFITKKLMKGFKLEKMVILDLQTKLEMSY